MDITKMKGATVNAVIRWAQTDSYEQVMRSKVNEYMEASGAHNSPAGEVGITLGRRIVAQELLFSCITPLSREQLRKAETMLLRIAEEYTPKT